LLESRAWIWSHIGLILLLHSDVKKVMANLRNQRRASENGTVHSEFIPLSDSSDFKDGKVGAF